MLFKRSPVQSLHQSAERFGARRKRSRKYFVWRWENPAKIDIKQMTKQPPCLGLGRCSFPSHLEAFAKVKLTADGIVDQKIFGALAFDAAFINQIGTIHDRQRFADIVVGDHDGET